MKPIPIKTLVTLAAGLLLLGPQAAAWPPAMASVSAGNMVSTTPDWTFESDQAGALLGTLVTTAGDVNGDGYDDLLVSASSFDNGQTDEGRVYLFLGSAAGPGLTPDWTFEPDQAGAGLRAAGSAGDVNGDGFDDVVVGAIGYDNGEIDEGGAWLFLGSAGGLSTTPSWMIEGNQAGAALGGSVGTAGDVNGDGYSDVHVSEVGFDHRQTNEGRALVFYGSASGLSTTPDWVVEGGQDNSGFGRGGTAGDVDGDGYDDLIVGAQGYDHGQTDEGRAYIFGGSRQGLKKKAMQILESNETSAFFGNQVGTVGDVNGDGFSDVFVNLINAPPLRVFVYLGSPTGPSSTPSTTLQTTQSSGFGGGLGSAGDVNGDGYADLCVGARFYDVVTADEGRAFLYLGSAGGLNSTAAQTFDGTQQDEELGVWCATAGDTNGDGFDDLIIGAFAYDNPEVNEGRALLYFGGM